MLYYLGKIGVRLQGYAMETEVLGSVVGIKSHTCVQDKQGVGVEKKVGGQSLGTLFLY